MHLPSSLVLLKTELERMDGEPREKFAQLIQDIGFQKEFVDQATAVSAKSEYPTASLVREFDVYAASGMNPLSNSAKCATFGCRMRYTEAFCRSTALYADRVRLVDFASSDLLEFFEHQADWMLEESYRSFESLLRMLPLIESDIVTLLSPNVGGIPGTIPGPAARNEMAEMLWAELLAADFEIGVWKDRQVHIQAPLFTIDGQVYFATVEAAPGVLPTSPISSKQTAGRVLLERHKASFIGMFEDEIHNSGLDALVSRASGSTLCLNQRLSAEAVRLFDGRALPKNSEHWSALRRLRLPWIQDLTPTEVVAVREHASTALPAMRARLTRDLSRIADGDDAAAEAIVADLRLEASEVAAELAATKISGMRQTNSMLAGLGFAILLYGISTGHAEAAVTGMTGLGLILSEAAKKQNEAEAAINRLKSKPAYLLVAAEHEHSS